jgi:hypothetical protein
MAILVAPYGASRATWARVPNLDSGEMEISQNITHGFSFILTANEDLESLKSQLFVGFALGVAGTARAREGDILRWTRSGCASEAAEAFSRKCQPGWALTGKTMSARVGDFLILVPLGTI